MVLPPSIATGWKTRSGPGHWAVPTGCSRVTAQWSTRGGHHDSDPVRQAERARSLCLPERCTDSPADSEEQRHQRAIDPQLEASYY